MYNVLKNIYDFLIGLTYTITYSFGEIWNATSETATTVSKTSIDLGNGALQDVGNLMTDVKCQYRGNPVSPNQCQPPKEEQPVVYVEVPVTQPPVFILPTNPPTTMAPTPRITGKFRPTTPAPTTVPIITTEQPQVLTRTAPIIMTPSPTSMIQMTPSLPSMNQIGSLPPSMGKMTQSQPPSMGKMGPQSQPPSMGKMGPQSQPPSMGKMTPPPPPFMGGVIPPIADKNLLQTTDKNFEPDVSSTPKRFTNVDSAMSSSINLDNVIENMSNRYAVSYDPEAATVFQSNKSKWCFVGDLDSKRTCVEIPSNKQSCMSGMMFPDQSTCMDPKK